MSGSRRCAVLGSPIAHSLSPVLHRAAYVELGLDWRYDAVEVDEAGLAGFLDGLGQEWRGLSLTMPLKRAVMPLLDEVRDRAVEAGAANTVVLEEGRRVGHNTDVPGAVAALRDRWEHPVRHALVVGGGATAASLLLALADLGCPDVTLAVREPNRAAATLEAVGRHPAPPEVTVVRLAKLGRGLGRRLGGASGEVDLVASTIPAGAQDDTVLAAAAGAQVVFDVLYDPWPTPLASAARSRGQVLVGGLDLLVHQAALQVELMTGQPAPLEVMAAAGEAALSQR
jgi:shikimate dehydrogenase